MQGEARFMEKIIQGVVKLQVPFADGMIVKYFVSYMHGCLQNQD